MSTLKRLIRKYRIRNLLILFEFNLLLLIELLFNILITLLLIILVDCSTYI